LTTVLGKTLREHVGGRWAISWLYYLINFPLVVFNAVHNSTNNPNGSFSAWLAIGLMGYLCFGLVFVLANFTLFRHRRVKPVPITWVICLGILAGSSRWLVVTLLPNEWGFSNEGPDKIAIAVLTGAILGGVFVPLTALIFSPIPFGSVHVWASTVLNLLVLSAGVISLAAAFLGGGPSLKLKRPRQQYH
jgi:hypothetical protein